MLALARVVALSSIPVLVSGQEPPTPIVTGYPLDSGYFDAGAGPAVVAVGTVLVVGAGWLQLHFGSCHLAPGSRLRLTAAADGAVQWFDQRSLVDYGFKSAHFNGDQVDVAVLPAPNSTGNRVVVQAVRIGERVIETDSLCAATDNRWLSSDPRVGRIDGCCTTFLVDARTLVSAGHCVGGIGNQIISFNVPLSDATGVAQYPPPEHQYALLAGSLTGVNGGLGNDWAVMSTVRNSNTGLYPGQAQGSWFEPVVPPPGTSYLIRVTGYGTHATPTWSLAQKTHLSGRHDNDPVRLAFHTSVTGCNSGSPAEHFLTTQALGVVTHAGCTGTSGANYATGFGLASFYNAVVAQRLSRVAGTTATFGTGCAGSGGVPTLSFLGFPDLGGSVTVQVSNLDPANNGLGALLFGFSNAVWSGGALPADLTGVGMPGCSLLVSPDASVPLSTNFGGNSYALALPNVGAFLATVVFCQHLSLDAGVANPAQAVASNGGRITVGN